MLRLFQLHLCLLAWDREGADAAVTAATAALQRGAAGGEGGRDSRAAQQLKLHFDVLQVCDTVGAAARP